MDFPDPPDSDFTIADLVRCVSCFRNILRDVSKHHKGKCYCIECWNKIPDFQGELDL